MPNPNFPAELGNIPYSEVIGGPLNAAVKANARASETAAKFIQTVGFQEPSDQNAWESKTKPVYVSFSYKKEVLDDQGNRTEKEFDLKVPMLLLLHVPYFEVSQVTIDFHAKLNSVQKHSVSNKFDIDSTVKGRHGWLMGNVQWKVNTSYQRQERRKQKIERTYDQDVHVEAEAIDAPEGVKKLLGVLEETITEGEPNGGNNQGNNQ